MIIGFGGHRRPDAVAFCEDFATPTPAGSANPKASGA